MVNRYGIGLIALSDRISQPEIQALLGLKYTGSWESNEKMIINGNHFLTRGIDSPFAVDSGADAHMQRQQVELLSGTVSLLIREPLPRQQQGNIHPGAGLCGSGMISTICSLIRAYALCCAGPLHGPSDITCIKPGKMR